MYQLLLRLAYDADRYGPYFDQQNNVTTGSGGINLSKPTGYVMHQQFNIQQLYALPKQCIYVFCIHLRTESDLCHLHHKLVGFYNRVETCLLRGTDWGL